MDLEKNLSGGAPKDWLTAALKKDNEAENSTIMTDHMPQTAKEDTSVDSLVHSEVVGDAGTTNQLQPGHEFGDVSIEADVPSTHRTDLITAVDLNGYGQAAPSMQTLTDELESLQSDHEFDNECSENEFYEALPNDGMPCRKIKRRHAPMNKEQQETEIQRLQALIGKYDEQESRISNSAPQVLQPAIDLEAATQVVPKADSPISDVGSAKSPPKNSLKRRRLSKSEEKISQKQKYIDIKPSTRNTLDLLIGLGKPFDENLGTIVDYVRKESMRNVRKDDDDIPIEELLKIRAEWKAEHERKLKQTIAFLERYGLIPFGGVDAAGSGCDDLG